MTGDIELPGWAFELLKPYRFKVVYGGRASGKSWAFATALLITGYRSPKRIIIAREYQKSVTDSAWRLLKDRIPQLGMGGYRIKQTSIEHVRGTVFTFHGLSTAQQNSIKGWESVDIVWIDEADAMSERSWELLRNTIRKPGSEIWITFNPYNRYDPVYEEFITNTPDNMFRLKVSYRDNKYFSAESEAGRLRDLKFQPAKYPHIWEGEPNDHADKQLVIPYALITSMRAMYESRYARGEKHAGFDIAASGSDKSALVIRTGPVITHIETWHEPVPVNSVKRVHRILEEHDVKHLYFDSTGLGDFIRGYIGDEYGRDTCYQNHPINFSSGVTLPQRRDRNGRKNKDAYANRPAQLGWNIRRRAELTQRLEAGESIPWESCLFIDPSIGEKALGEITQPTWRDEGKLTIDKKGTGSRSPDIYDAVILSFARDTE